MNDWPTCGLCRLPYIPVDGVIGDPWCAPKRVTNVCPDCGGWKHHGARRCRACSGRGGRLPDPRRPVPVPA